MTAVDDERVRRTGQLSTAQLEDFVNALLAAGLTDPTVRQLCAEQVEREIGANPQRSEIPRADAWAIADACSRFDDGIHRLVAIVRAILGPGGPVDRLADVAHVVCPRPILDEQQFHELVDTVAGVSWEHVAPLWRGQRMSAYAQPLSFGRDVGQLLESLNWQPFRAGAAPPLLLLAVDQIAHAQRGWKMADIHRWVEARAEQLGCLAAMDEICRGSRRRKRAAENTTYLMIRLRPGGAGRKGYLTKSCLWGEHGDEQPLHDDRRARSRGQLERKLSALLDDLGARAIDQDRVAVEFFLPRCLMDTDVANLQITVANADIRLGIKHAVVVRSLDRLDLPGTHGAWERKWDCLLRAEVQYGTDGGYHHRAMHLVDGERAADYVYAALAGDGDESWPVCLIFSEPLPWPVTNGYDALSVAWEVGMPIAAWPTKLIDNSRFADLFHGLLRGSGLSRLPTAALNARRNAEKNGQGHPNISILFDDPTRIPNSLKLGGRLRPPGVPPAVPAPRTPPSAETEGQPLR